MATSLAHISFTSLVPDIKNIRYGPVLPDYGTILFDFKNIECRIVEPANTILVGYPDANKWIAENYGFLLMHLPDDQKVMIIDECKAHILKRLAALLHLPQ